MKVKRIYSRDIVRAPRSCSLEGAAMLMRKHHVGLLVVTEDAPEEERAIGVLTDRDMVLQAMADGIGPRDTSIGEIMTPRLATISENADVFEALESMRTNAVRRLAVSGEKGALVGVVSLDDVIDAFGAELASLAAVIRSEYKREGDEVD